MLTCSHVVLRLDVETVTLESAGVGAKELFVELVMPDGGSRPIVICPVPRRSR